MRSLSALAVLALVLALAACGDDGESATRKPHDFSSVTPESPEEFCALVAGTRNKYDHRRPWIDEYCVPTMQQLGADLTWVEQNMVASCLIDNRAASLHSCIETVAQNDG